jgi:hypothetical protein
MENVPLMEKVTAWEKKMSLHSLHLMRGARHLNAPDFRRSHICDNAGKKREPLDAKQELKLLHSQKALDILLH